MTIATVPATVVSLSGERLSSGDMEHLAYVRIHQVLSLPALCELRFVDPTEDFSRLAGRALGSPLSVAVADQTGRLFSGEVTAVDYDFEPDAGRIIRIRAYDLLHRLRKRRPLRTHTDVAVVDLAEELVADLGLTVEAQLEGPRWQRIFQSRQSDWELLRDLSGRAGLYFALRDGTLTFMTLEGDGRTFNEAARERPEGGHDARTEKVEPEGGGPAGEPDDGDRGRGQTAAAADAAAD